MKIDGTLIEITLRVKTIGVSTVCAFLLLLTFISTKLESFIFFLVL